MIGSTELFVSLLLKQVKGDVEGVKDLQVNVDFTPEWTTLFDEQTHTRLQGRLTHVKGLYKPFHVREGHFIFTSGCLESYQDGILKFRKRSEWFPKLISDLLYVSSIANETKMTLTIPKLFMKPEACPVIRQWATIHKFPYSDWINEQADLIIHKYPFPLTCLSNKRRACRAWLLRWHVLNGNLSADQFQNYRRV